MIAEVRRASQALFVSRMRWLAIVVLGQMVETVLGQWELLSLENPAMMDPVGLSSQYRYPTASPWLVDGGEDTIARSLGSTNDQTSWRGSSAT